jgi:hypothetical protein
MRSPAAASGRASAGGDSGARSAPAAAASDRIRIGRSGSWLVVEFANARPSANRLVLPILGTAAHLAILGRRECAIAVHLHIPDGALPETRHLVTIPIRTGEPDRLWPLSGLRGEPVTSRESALGLQMTISACRGILATCTNALFPTSSSPHSSFAFIAIPPPSPKKFFVSDHGTGASGVHKLPSGQVLDVAIATRSSEPNLFRNVVFRDWVGVSSADDA